MLLLALAEAAQGYLSDTMALAAVALIGYLVGRRTRKEPAENPDEQLLLELSRAVHVANELHSVAQRIRQDVASHQSSILQFKSRVNKLKTDELSEGWKTLSSEAEALLAPTMQLATKLSLAYDQLRKQSTLLMNFAGSRTDTETGVLNRRAMVEQLDVLFSLHAQDDSRFALSLFSVEDHSEHGADFQNSLPQFTKILSRCARDTDLVARYSTDEFVVLMPQTTMVGATVFSDRLLNRARTELGCIACGGVVEILPQDTPEKLLSRADSALYSARASETNCLFQHNGKTIRAYNSEQDSEIVATTPAQNQPKQLEPEMVESTEADPCLTGRSTDY